MKDTPQAIRPGDRERGRGALEGRLDAAIPQKSSIDVSIGSSLVRRRGRARRQESAGRGTAIVRYPGTLAEPLGAMI